MGVTMKKHRVTKKRVSRKKKKAIKTSDLPVQANLAGLSFTQAVSAALQTGSMPKALKKTRKAKSNTD
jgi:hypothetical protein